MTSDQGAVLILVVLSLVMLFGMVALAIDASHAYDIRNRLAAAADAGAKAGAVELWRGNATTYAVFANSAIDWHQAAGQIPANTARTIRLCSEAAATCLAPYRTNKYVEVILTATYRTVFGAMVHALVLTPGARAVAGTSPSPYCLITLDPSSPSLEIGNSTITANGCAVETGGPISGSNPGATIMSQGVSVAGGCSGTCTGFAGLQTNQPPPSDPLAGQVPTPPACTPAPITVIGGTWNAGCYSNVIIDGVVMLTGGIYQIYGSVLFKNNTQITMAPNTGFLYFGPAATFDFRQNTSLQVTAQVGGLYNGIAVYVDKNNTSDWDMHNHSGVEVTGAFYAPNTNVIFDNHLNTSSDCTLFVVGTLDIKNGNGVMGNACSAYGGSPITSVALAE